MLNEAMDSAVLVKGWKKGANWSFPRGKINKDEDDLACAIREAYEETGYDLEAAGLVPKDRNVKYIEINMREQQMRLYVFRNIPMDTHFEPKTRKEISKIQWWHLSELPAFRKKGHQQQQTEAATSPNKFYMVAPFLVPLKKWVVEQKKRDAKLAANNHYLAPNFSQDEGLTEEDQKSDSYNRIQPPAASFTQEVDTLEGATAALTRLLKIQPPTQGIQADAVSAVQAPGSKNSGEALLALVQGNRMEATHPVPNNPAPHTPLDHPIPQQFVPEIPHHTQARPHFSSLPPPPFSIQSSTDNSYLPSHYNHPGQASFHMPAQQGPGSAPHQTSASTHPYAYQSQHLVHPQPLPPNVQKAIFTDRPDQFQTMPQPLQHQAPPPPPQPLSSMSNPQFPGLHAPMISPEMRAPQPKLTSHSLALLNAFKSRDPTNAARYPANGAYQSYPGQNAETKRPHELATDMPNKRSVNIPSQTVSAQHPVDAMNFGPLASRQPVNDAHRSNLLDLFKSPKSKAQTLSLSQSSPSAASAVPVSAVELSASELSSSVPSVQKTSTDKMIETKQTRTSITTVGSPEGNTNSRPISILPRPPQASNQVAQISNRQDPIIPDWSTPKPHASASVEKPFQPQILKRPQPAASVETRPQSTSSSITVPLIQPLLDRHTPQAEDHKKTLLSLFANTGPSPPSNSLARDNTQVADLTSILRDGERRIPNIGNLAVPGNEGITVPRARKESYPAISPADQGFLLNYLDAVAKDNLR